MPMNRAAIIQFLRGLPALRLTNDRPLDVSGLSVGAQDEAHCYFAAACSRLDGASQLREAGRDLPAVLLYREGLLMLARVLIVARGEEAVEVPTDPEATLERFAALIGSERTTLVAALRDSLSVPDGTSLDRLPREALETRANSLSKLAVQLVALVEPTTRERAWFAQYAPAVSFLLTLVVLLGTAAYFAFLPTNIAKGKPVVASSAGLDTKPEGAVDGRDQGAYGFHSEGEASPWIRVDLGRLYRITEIKIRGRHDCCYAQSVPMVCEVSDDDEQFSVIGTRTEPFEQVEPWSLSPKGIEGRFVRVRSLNPSVLVLSEIEVYGRRLE
jgi:hypothetical protein